DDSRLLCFLALEPRRQPRLVHRLTRRDEPELDVAVRPADLLLVENMARVEVADLAGDAGGEPRRVEGFNRSGAGSPGDHPAPRRCDVVAEGSQHAHPGDDDTPRLGRPGRRSGGRAHRTSLPVRTVAA